MLSISRTARSVVKTHKQRAHGNSSESAVGAGIDVVNCGKQSLASSVKHNAVSKLLTSISWLLSLYRQEVLSAGIVQL